MTESKHPHDHTNYLLTIIIEDKVFTTTHNTYVDAKRARSNQPHDTFMIQKVVTTLIDATA